MLYGTNQNQIKMFFTRGAANQPEEYLSAKISQNYCNILNFITICVLHFITSKAWNDILYFQGCRALEALIDLYIIGRFCLFVCLSRKMITLSNSLKSSSLPVEISIFKHCNKKMFSMNCTCHQNKFWTFDFSKIYF